jgi:hypothetical protein
MGRRKVAYVYDRRCTRWRGRGEGETPSASRRSAEHEFLDAHLNNPFN